MSTCRSCRAEITWATTPNGKAIPLDMTPVAVDSTGAVIVVPVALTDGGLKLWGYSLTVLVNRVAEREGVSTCQALERISGDYDAYTTHFSTCPNAGQHRKARA